MFVDRKNELAALEALFESDKPKMVLLYGRRRIGKTELLKHLSKRTSGVYFLARQEAEKDQLKGFSFVLSERFNDTALDHSPLQNYDALFAYLKEHVPNGTPIIFDEFPYMVQSNPSLPSILQDHWDNHFQKKKSFILLCGSSMRMMERLAGYKSPLYGRRTEQMLLGPLGFFDATEFMGKIGLEQAVSYYAILGGTPAYLQLFDYKKSLEDNLKTLILPKLTFLNQDALFILREELDEPRNYFSILKSISKGNTQLGSIINDTGLDRNLVAKYLSVLNDLHIVKREIPITERGKSRNGIYRLSDPYFRFWFRFIFDNLEYLESAGAHRTFEDRIKPELNAYVGSVFEDVALQWLRKQKQLSTYVFGRWWKDETEIDVVGLDEKNKKNLMIEVKWSDLSELDARRLLNNLNKKAIELGKSKSNQLGLIAKNIESKDKLVKEGHLIFELDDMKNEL